VRLNDVSKKPTPCAVEDVAPLPAAKTLEGGALVPAEPGGVSLSLASACLPQERMKISLAGPNWSTKSGFRFQLITILGQADSWIKQTNQLEIERQLPFGNLTFPPPSTFERD